MKGFYTALLVSSLCCIIPQYIFAQGEVMHWYFGDRIHLVATTATYSPIAPLQTLEGCAAVSSHYGEELFFTNGVTVWLWKSPTEYDVMLGGNNLAGNASSTQSALILPWPGTYSGRYFQKYFIFTAGAGPYVDTSNHIGIRYSVVDYSSSPVVIPASTKNVLLLDSATEKLVGAGNCGEGYWAIAHGWGNNKFYAWAVSDTGVSTQPVISTTGAIHTTGSPLNTIGYMKVSPNGKRLALAGNIMGIVQLFDFNPFTGIVSNPITLPSSAGTSYGEYGVSFSSDNTKLYIAGVDSTFTSRLYQYSVTGATATEVIASRTLIFEANAVITGNEFGALQLTSEGKIYCARSQSAWLGVINNPNAAGTACNYVQDGFDLKGFHSTYGLPNFVDNFFNTSPSCYKPHAIIGDHQHAICEGECIVFYDRSASFPTSRQWSFPGGIPASSTEKDPRVCYTASGTYDVVLIVSNENGSDTTRSTADINVSTKPVANAGSDVVLCLGSSTILSATSATGFPTGTRFEWSPKTGLDRPFDAVTTARPLSTTAYILKVTSGSCTVYDTVVVKVNPLPSARSGTYGLCKGERIKHDALISVGTYLWDPPAGVSDITSPAPYLSPDKTTHYVVTVTDANGCSSSATVDVSVEGPAIVRVKEKEKDMTICQGDTVILNAEGNLAGDYRWVPANSVSDSRKESTKAFPASTTTYIVTLTTTLGCIARDTVTVFVHPRPSVKAEKDTMVCPGSDAILHAFGSTTGTYRWSPITDVEHPDSAYTIVRPTVKTVYTVTFTDIFGCKASASVTISTKKISIGNGGPFTLCAGESITLHAAGGEGTYKWSPAESLDDPESPSPVATPTHTTMYILIFTSKDGCVAKSQVLVDVVAEGKADAGEDKKICQGDSVQLEVKGLMGQYNWTPETGLNDPHSPTPIASPSTTTTYTIYISSPKGCTATDSVKVIVSPKPSVSAGDDIFFCAGNPVQLEAKGNAQSYEWSPAQGLDNPTSRTPIASPSQTTTYRVTARNTDGCSATDEVTAMIVSSLPVDAGEDKILCPGEQVYLTITGATGTYLWSPDVGLDDPHSRNPLASPGSSTMYHVVVENSNGCKGEDSVMVTVFPVPSVEAGKDRQLCKGSDSIPLQAVGSEGTVVWQPSEGLSDPHSRTPLAAPDMTTLYFVTLTNSNGCHATDSVRVSVDALPVVAAGMDTAVCAGQEVRLAAVGSAGSYHWTGDNVEHPDNALTTAHPQKTTSYSVVLTNANNCIATDTVNVVVYEPSVAIVSLPDTAGSPGSRGYHLPLTIQIAPLPPFPVKAKVRMNILYNERLIEFTGITKGSILKNPSGLSNIITVEIDEVNLTTSRISMTDLVGTILMTTVPSTSLIIDSLSIDLAQTCIEAVPHNGSLRLEGYCVTYDFHARKHGTASIAPNPVSTRMDIHLYAGETKAEHCSVEMYTLWGARVLQQQLSGSVTGEDEQVFSFDVAQMAAGMYSVRIIIDGESSVHPVYILR